MRRWGEGDRFLQRIERHPAPRTSLATFRSSFILGYPGETEDDHDRLLGFLESGPSSTGPASSGLAESPARTPSLDRIRSPGRLRSSACRECSEIQDSITANRRDRLVGERRTVLVDSPGIGRTVHEAPEIDGIVRVPGGLEPGSLVDLTITASFGTDLEAEDSGTFGSATECPSRPGCPVTDTAGHGFGPSALATPANALTVLRLVGTPIFIGFIVTQGATWWTVVVGLILAGTDGLDGWVSAPARGHSLGGFP